MPVSSNGTITAPVSIRDIQRALGTSIPDLGRLCRHSKINMWAKYKPVKKAMIDTTGQLKSDKTWKPINGTGGLGTDAWYRGVINTSTNTDFGITPKYVNFSTGVNDMITALNTLANNEINGEKNGWVYSVPTGGSSEPYRQLDFNRYYHDAPEPVKTVSGMPDVMAAANSIWEYSVQIMGSAMNDEAGNVDDRNYLLASDIIGTCYLGIAIFRKVNGAYDAMGWTTDSVWCGVGMKSAGTNEDRTAGTTTVSAKLVAGNTYYAIPVFFAEPLPQERESHGTTVTIFGESLQPGQTGTPTRRVWTVPYTTFVAFTMHLASTSQRWGMPIATSHTIGMVGYRTKLYLDRTTDASYYNATGTVVVQYAMVNELWNETNVPANWPSGSYVGFNSETLTITSTNQNINLNNGNYYSPTLTPGHTWRLVFIVDGELTIVNLRQYQEPAT